MIDNSDDEFGINPLHILEENLSMTHRTNTDFSEARSIIERSPLALPASATKDPVTLDSLLTSLYPRKYKRVSDLEIKWCENQSKKRHKKHVHTEAKTLIRILKVMSSKNLSFVADILQVVLKNNIELKEGLEMKEHEIAKRSEQIIESVKHFVKLRLTKSKTKQAEEALLVLVKTCRYTNSDGDDHNSVRKILGFSTGDFYRNIIEQNIVMDMTSYAHIDKNKRKQTELSKKQE